MSSLGISAVPTSIQPAVHRPTVELPPTIWADYFLSHSTSSIGTVNSSNYEEIEGLKEEIRLVFKEYLGRDGGVGEMLQMIDDVQRLGVGYHFHGEIEAALEELSHANVEGFSLATVSLWFRLLRQQGINVSCDVFNKYKDSQGNFKASSGADVREMLSLYEASHLATWKDKLLKEALEFSTQNLKAALPSLSPPLALQVSHSLRWPLRFSLNRAEAKFYIDIYSQDESHNTSLLKFAKIDFNTVQQLHQEELHTLTRWYKSLDWKKNFPYSRDRIVESYFWMVHLYFEPQYFLGRIIMTKICQMTTLLDDTYDNYGLFEELQTLTEAIDRWDIEAIDVLPENMKMLYQVLIGIYSEVEDALRKEGRLNCMYYVKQAMKNQVKAYFGEAKWRQEAYVPNFDEYMEVAIPSSAILMLTVSSFVGMGEVATEEAFKWIFNYPKIIISMAVHGRLLDDVVSHEFERKRDHVTSAVECYMNQYHVQKEEAVKVLREKARDGWKDINVACLKPTEVPMPLLDRALNFAKATETFYKDGDGYTDNHLIKDLVTSLLKNPVSI